MAVSLFVFTGTYNAVVINSESHISGSEVKFVKRLDELYGVTVPGREVAASVTWTKLKPAEVIAHKQQQEVIQNISMASAAPVSAPVPENSGPESAAVQEELSLHLVEVINPNKWKNGVPAGQFSGSLSTNQGVIESLSVSLPDGEGVSVSFSEMNGNVFEYDIDGELYSGMMYQVDQHSYMVTLTNGPLEGTRLRFSTVEANTQYEQSQQYLVENNVEVGTFGNENNFEYNYENKVGNVTTDELLQQQSLQAHGMYGDNTQQM